MKRFSRFLTLIVLVMAGFSACYLFSIYDIRGAWNVNVVQGGVTTTSIMVCSGSKDTGTLTFTLEGDNYTGTYTVQSKKVTISIQGDTASEWALLEGDFTSKDDMSGNWSNADGDSGTWTGVRR